MNQKTKKLTVLGALCALAYAATALGRVPLVLFLKYDPKDIVLALSGLLFGPLTACAAALLVARKRPGARGAAVGLLFGWGCMVLVMLFWNYLITPLYMGIPRAAVAELLLPAFLPFNLLKGGINAGVTLVLYQPVARALARSKLL